MLDRTVERLAALLHGHAFREVPGLVHIGPFQHRRAIGQELDGIAYSIGATKGAHLGIAIPKVKAFDQLVRNWPVHNDADDARTCLRNDFSSEGALQRALSKKLGGPRTA